MDSGGDGEILNYNISHVRNTNIPLFWMTLYSALFHTTPKEGDRSKLSYRTSGEWRGWSLKEVTWTCAIDLKSTKMYPQS